MMQLPLSPLRILSSLCTRFISHLVARPLDMVSQEKLKSQRSMIDAMEQFYFFRDQEGKRLAQKSDQTFWCGGL